MQLRMYSPFTPGRLIALCVVESLRVRAALRWADWDGAWAAMESGGTGSLRSTSTSLTLTTTGTARRSGLCGFTSAWSWARAAGESGTRCPAMRFLSAGPAVLRALDRVSALHGTFLCRVAARGALGPRERTPWDNPMSSAARGRLTRPCVRAPWVSPCRVAFRHGVQGRQGRLG